MTEFKASNGWYIDRDGDLNAGADGFIADAGEVVGARQFFQELRDHELGRWRDPENPEYVVYPKDRDFVVVIDESTGASVGLTRDDIDGFAVSTLCVQVAKRYFAAHPQHKPLPTKPGLYIHRLWRKMPGKARVLRLSSSVWDDVDQADGRGNALEVAQEWHEAGELVRLVPEGGDDE